MFSIDLPLNAVLEFSGSQELKDAIHSGIQSIFHQFAVSFNLQEEFLEIDDLFVAKYESEMGKQSYLRPHQDKNPWSFVISLNSDYEDGGTYFVSINELWRAGVGSSVLFHGMQLHAGNECILCVKSEHIS